jgi:hypothetical protein
MLYVIGTNMEIKKINSDAFIHIIDYNIINNINTVSFNTKEIIIDINNNVNIYKGIVIPDMNMSINVEKIYIRCNFGIHFDYELNFTIEIKTKIPMGTTVIIGGCAIGKYNLVDVIDCCENKKQIICGSSQTIDSFSKKINPKLHKYIIDQPISCCNTFKTFKNNKFLIYFFLYYVFL